METVRLKTQVLSATLLGGEDNPNCFTLPNSTRDGAVRIVNMKLGPFYRVCEQVDATDVEVRLLSPYAGVIVDPRFPEHELTNHRWCTVCCPTQFLPEEQLRNYLRYMQPTFIDGILMSWSGSMNKQFFDEEVEANMVRLKEYHGKTS